MQRPTCGLGRAPVGVSGDGATVTGKEFKRTLERLNVSQLGAGRLFGVDSRTIRAWVADAAKIPEAVAILVRLLVAGLKSRSKISRPRRGPIRNASPPVDLAVGSVKKKQNSGAKSIVFAGSGHPRLVFPQVQGRHRDHHPEAQRDGLRAGEFASVPFLTFVANKLASGDAANYSFVLRGYVRHWLGNVWGEYDRVKLNEIVATAAAPAGPRVQVAGRS